MTIVKGNQIFRQSIKMSNAIDSGINWSQLDAFLEFVLDGAEN